MRLTQWIRLIAQLITTDISAFLPLSSYLNVLFFLQGSKLWIIMEYLGGGSALDLVSPLTLSVSLHSYRMRVIMCPTPCLCVCAAESRTLWRIPDSHHAEGDFEGFGLPALWEENPQGHKRCVRGVSMWGIFVSAWISGCDFFVFPLPFVFPLVWTVQGEVDSGWLVCK